MNHRLASLALLFGLAACGGGGGGGSTPPPPPGPSPTPPAQTTATVSGKLVAPDNTTPISNALVYVEGSEIVPAPPRMTPAGAPPPAAQCGTPPTAGWSYTCTGADGTFSFTLKIPDNAKLVATKGAFRFEQQLGPASATLNLGTLALPTSGPGSTRMAVVTGLFDRMQDVLAKLGYGEVDNGRLRAGTEKFDLYDGDGSLGAGARPMDALFADGDGNGQPDIRNYAVVFLNCGVDETAALDPTRLQILRDYVQAGGRLYVSDLAYDFVEQAFPAYIDFHGSDGTAAAAAENPGDAEVGEPDITSAATVDAGLQSWLGGVSCSAGSCLDAGGTVTIEGFLSGWGVMNGAQANPPSAVKTWVQGPVTFFGQSTPVVRPLTMTFGAGSGRVTYTSYHTESGFSASSGFLPQERILQFLVFEL